MSKQRVTAAALAADLRKAADRMNSGPMTVEDFRSLCEDVVFAVTSSVRFVENEHEKGK